MSTTAHADKPDHLTWQQRAAQQYPGGLNMGNYEETASYRLLYGGEPGESRVLAEVNGDRGADPLDLSTLFCASPVMYNTLDAIGVAICSMKQKYNDQMLQRELDDLLGSVRIALSKAQVQQPAQGAQSA